jgi:hypothetical protein
MVIISKTLDMILSLILTKLSIKWLWDLQKLQHHHFSRFLVFHLDTQEGLVQSSFKGKEKTRMQFIW